MKGIYKFYWDCGRMGDLDGIFVAEKKDVAKVIGKNVYFGEVLGKHSEIEGTVEKGDIELLSDDQDFIKKFVKIMGTDSTVSGYNPLDYYEEEDA